MTDPDPLTNPSEDDSVPPTWLIAIGIVVVLAFILLVGFGAGQQWGAAQWGPLAAWFAGGLTFAAVVVALRESFRAQREARRAQFARLVDHEISRRRECIKALADLWGAITGMQMEFASWADSLDRLPPSKLNDGDVARARAIIQDFSAKWQNKIEPPLFVALALLHGTDLQRAMKEVNDRLDTIKDPILPTIQAEITARQRPDTSQLREEWHVVINQRSGHLQLARKHFSLTREDVGKSVHDEKGRAREAE